MASTTTTTTISLICILFFFVSLVSAAPNDTAALLQFLSQTNNPTSNFLSTNWTTNDACSSVSWQGVNCTGNRVTSLILPSSSLHGSIDPLSSLTELRILDLQNNTLNGTLQSITICTNLKHLYLSNNDFSGELPSDIGSLRRLVRLDLSYNNLDGVLPKQIFNLTRLATLKLQNNSFSGSFPDLNSTMSQLKELNISNNQFSGQLPENLQNKYGNNSFTGNPKLCGLPPLPDCSSPPQPTTTEDDFKPKSFQLNTGMIVAIVLCISVVIVSMFMVAIAYMCAREDYNGSIGDKMNGGGQITIRRGTYQGEPSKLVFFDKTKEFELDTLLRASAEMLGKGGLGTVYKAELNGSGGNIVAVKRLNDLNSCPKKDFERYMNMIGKLRHANIVCLRAYYYEKGEKFLVSEYLPNGSLHSLLHANRGPGRIPLDWTTRINLVLGTANGLAKIHEEYSSSKIAHGNVKSSNVLVDKNGIACVSDCGLALLLNPAEAIERLGGYRAPEQVETKELTPVADVYSFGVLILEVLTGRSPSQSGSDEEQGGMSLPKWVRSSMKDEWSAEVFDFELLRYKNIEGELVRMLNIGLACVAEQPEKRPTMREVAKMIEDIRVGQSTMANSSLSPSIVNTEAEDAHSSS